MSRLLPALVLAVLAAVPLTACSAEVEPPHEPGGLALVVGGRANMPRPQLVAEADRFAREALLSQDHLVVVGVSGKPDIPIDERLTTECDSPSGCDAAAGTFIDELRGVLDGVRAKTDEADTLGAILLAAAELDRAGGSGPKRIVVIDNGLQTAGALRLQAPGALSAAPAAVVKSLGDKLEPLAGKEVLLTGLGSVAAPQPALSAEDDQRLGTLWTGILAAAGATVHRDRTALSDAPPPDGLPAVTPVVPEQPPVVKPGDCRKLREDQVGFRPDSPEFVDPARTREVLAPIAAGLREKGTAATVTGTTALPEAAPFPLSTQRAQAVVDQLVGMGVSADLLKAAGVGTHFPGWADPRGQDGAVNETLAVQYRLVLIAEVGQSCGQA